MLCSGVSRNTKCNFLFRLDCNQHVLLCDGDRVHHAYNQRQCGPYIGFVADRVKPSSSSKELTQNRTPEDFIAIRNAILDNSSKLAKQKKGH